MRSPPAVAAGTLMPPHGMMRHFAAAMCAAALIGCSDSANPTGANEDLTGIAVTANVTNTQINVLVITVSAADITTPLVFNLPVASGIASGTLRLPAGDDRLITVQAFDVTGEVTHDGSVTIDVVRGQNPPLSVSLLPRNGQLPIEIAMGPYSVVVAPASHTMQVGETVTLTVTVTEPNGDAVSQSVLWATADPSIATVSGAGVVTGHRAGITQIVATYGGVAGAMQITISDGGAPIVIVGPVYPPPGGVTFSGTGNAGLPGGRTNVYTNFDLSTTRVMAWGVDATSAPGVSLNGLTIEGAEVMVLNPYTSNPAAGVIRWDGFTSITLNDGVNQTMATRLTLTITTFDGTTSTPVALVPASEAGLPAHVGWVAPITSEYNAGTSLRANLLFEAHYPLAFAPAYQVFNDMPNKLPGVQSASSFAGGFYYSY